jgi:alpha-N-arabinofuranosidase
MRLLKALLLTLAVVQRVPCPAAGLLQNPDFEELTPTAGWEVTTYGGQPRFGLDSALARSGRTALSIDAAESSDTALAQEVSLTPSQWYRFSAWIRTDKLDPHGSAVSATVQVQRPKGAGLIAGAPSHVGSTAWTNTDVYFQAPPDGRVRLCLFFVGFGRGTGSVWFDGVRVEPIDFKQGGVVVTREPLVSAAINPMQYGQFVEYLCDLVPSMWAEKLYDGSFEGLTPYKVAFIKETDFKEKPWYPSGAANRGRYTLDKQTAISGQISQKIEVQGSEPCTLGISQDGISVERGNPCQFHCWLRTEGITEPVRIRLHREGKTYAACSFRPSGNWQKFTSALRPNGTDANATLSVEFRGPGTLWIDNASLMPLATIGGWRPDVVKSVRALKPRIIRFGGSALDEPGYGEFEWKDTVGDPDRRKPFRAWGGLQPTGPGLEEFVQFCRAVDAEPMICVRFANRTPRDAADQVEYFNGAPTTRMGSERKRNGHSEPYRIKYWQVGNERQSKDYDDQVAAFCEAMKAVDPTISLLSSFPTARSVQNAGAWFDYVCPHHYTPNLGECESNFSFIRNLLRQNGSRKIKVAVTEWNTTAGDWGPGRATLMTLANALACSRYHNLLHRNSDLVEIANRSNLINSFGSGILQVDNHRLYKTPTYYAQLLYATLAGKRALRIDSMIPATAGLDLSATWDPEGRRMVLFAVNSSLSEITRLLDVSALGRGGQRLTCWTVGDRERAGEPDVRNSFADPERIGVHRSSLGVSSPKFEYRFPALSLTVLQLAVRDPHTILP